MSEGETNGYFQQKKKRNKPCDGLTDIVFIFVDMFSGQHYNTIQSQKLFFVKTPYTFKIHFMLVLYMAHLF